MLQLFSSYIGNFKDDVLSIDSGVKLLLDMDDDSIDRRPFGGRFGLSYSCNTFKTKLLTYLSASMPMMKSDDMRGGGEYTK